MRSTWNGALAVGLLVTPVKLYRITGDDEYAFRQVHKKDGGRIQFRRYCSLDGEEVPYADIGKGKEVGDQMFVLTDEELESLPLPGAKVIAIELFVHAGEIDLSGLGKAYYIEPDPVGLKAYTLLRQQIKASGKVGIARFAMRSKDCLVVIRAHRKMLILQQLAWPADIREPAFKFLREEVAVTDKERLLAAQLIDTLSGPWDPGAYTSKYGEAVEKLIQAKLAGSPPPEPTPAQAAAVADIGEVLKASIEAAKAKREEGTAA